MYELKTLLPKMEIDLPTCMYSIRKCGLDFEDKKDDTSLETKQDNLIKQLHNLKKQLADIRVSLKMPELPQTSFIGNKLKEETLHDIVINAHPNFVPYALLALQNAWKTIFNVKIKIFSHSTVSKISKEAEHFQKTVENSVVSNDLPTINITLIWKNCEHTEMISSPTMYVPIYGEVNIIRFLGRVGPIEYRYENSILCNEIDAVLDICYQLLRCSTNKARSNLIRYLSNYLQKQEYFGGCSMSIADIAVCSTLKRLPQVSMKDLSNELIEWHKRAKIITLL